MAKGKDLIEQRKEKVKKLRDYGMQLHPERYEITNTIGESRKLEDGTKNISIAGVI